METEILTRLLEITLYSALILIAVLLFRAAFKKWLSPRLRYALWFLVLLRLVVPITFESPLHLITLPEETAATADGGILEPAPVLPAALPETEPMPAAGGAPAQGAGTAFPGTEAAPQQALRRKLPTTAQWHLIVWLAGMLLMLLGYLGMTIQLERRIRRFGRKPGPRMQKLFCRVCSAMGIRRTIAVRVLDDIGSPALTAQIVPKLLLPASLAAGGERENLVFSLVHELTHYVRRDYAACLAVVLLRAIYWFNPVVWILPRFLRADMEAACDARVVRDMDKKQKLRYANLLLELGQEDTV